MKAIAKRADGTTRIVDLSRKSIKRSGAGKLARTVIGTAQRHSGAFKRSGLMLRDVLEVGAGACTVAAVEGVTGEVTSVGPVPIDAAVSLAVVVGAVAVGGPAMHVARAAAGGLTYRLASMLKGALDERRVKAELEAAQKVVADKAAKDAAERSKNQIPVEESPAVRIERQLSEAMAMIEGLKRERMALSPANPAGLAAPAPALATVANGDGK